MHSRAILLGLLLGLVILSTGASSVDGVRQADEWLYVGDLAFKLRQPAMAYSFYEKVVTTFPGGVHAQVAAKRGNYCRHLLRHPKRVSPPGEDGWGELYDMLTW